MYVYIQYTDSRTREQADFLAETDMTGEGIASAVIENMTGALSVPGQVEFDPTWIFLDAQRATAFVLTLTNPDTPDILVSGIAWLETPPQPHERSTA